MPIGRLSRRKLLPLTASLGLGLVGSGCRYVTDDLITPTATIGPTPLPTPTGLPPRTTATPTATPSRPIDEATLLNSLHIERPRLLTTGADWGRLRSLVADDEGAQRLHKLLSGRVERLVTLPPPIRPTGSGPQLAGVASRLHDRLVTLALLSRLDNNQAWTARAARELLAVANWSDWYPGALHEISEIVGGMAIGYDWLHPHLSASERATIRLAILDKGLRPLGAAYRARAGWTTAPSVTGLLGNRSVILGALAVADEEPVLARRLLAAAIANLGQAVAAYAPDGSWPEGLVAWSSATLGLVQALSALASALGTDFGLGQRPGLAETGLFRTDLTGPMGLIFNFAGAAEIGRSEPALFWLAERYQRPLLAWAARRAITDWPSPYDLLWYSRLGSANDQVERPLDQRYRRAEVVTLRSAWEDPRAIFVAFKGGNNAPAQSHLDLGAYVIDALGQRWAVDPAINQGEAIELDRPVRLIGPEWARTDRHNTITLDGQNQAARATAPITLFRSTPGSAWAMADLAGAYQAARSMRRGVALLPGRQRLVIVDEIVAKQPVEIIWRLYTQAAVTIKGNEARLSQGGQTFFIRLLEEGQFRVENMPPPASATPVPPLRRLVIHLPQKVSRARIVVLCFPGGEATPTIKIAPLDRWEASGPL